MTQKGLKERLEFLETYAPGMVKAFDNELKMADAMGNIESFVGSMTLPLGLVGPLPMKWDNQIEPVFGVVATSEGALVASMNRGCRAIADGAYIETNVEHKLMTRMPMFSFSNNLDCARFISWFKQHESAVKKKAQEASNHATLLAFEYVQIDESAHIKFKYDTGDASGQNMTTACTWHACKWIFNAIEQEGIELQQFGIEGNGASDKKISQANISKGRGHRVVSKALVSDVAIKKHLRVEPDALISAFERSKRIAAREGMVGFNINAVNAIAAIYAATGQDLACIAESSTAFLELERLDGEVSFKLTLTNLVIGTLGGGTGLPTQNAALTLMRCNGVGKIDRFARIIAGYALALELSTLSAVVGGQFARAHEVFGRNKPKKWLVRSEFDQSYVKSIVGAQLKDKIVAVDFTPTAKLDNGILTDLSTKLMNKLVGFIPFNLILKDGNQIPVLAKSKALDIEILKGIHLMASQVDIGLADAILAEQDRLEYKNCHIKELEVFDVLSSHGFEQLPRYYGNRMNHDREVYLVLEERLEEAMLSHYNTELSPEVWQTGQVKSAIDALVDFQVLSLNTEVRGQLAHVQEFDSRAIVNLYTQLVDQCKHLLEDGDINGLVKVVDVINQKDEVKTLKVLVHNDYNPRNIAIRSSGKLVIYDWELAVFGSPVRDLIEFLSFVITDAWSDQDILDMIEYHRQRLMSESGKSCDVEHWKEEIKRITAEYMAGRVTFYLLGESMLNYGFSKRILSAALRISNLV